MATSACDRRKRIGRDEGIVPVFLFGAARACQGWFFRREGALARCAGEVSFFRRVRGLCPSADEGGVLSHSRERTKGRPGAAKPRQRHGCPRTPRRLVWGRNLWVREAIGFLAGAAWSSFGGYVCCPLAVGRHRWAALVARGSVSLGCACWRMVPLPICGCAGRSFPLAGKNQRATGGSQSETAPWLPPGPSPLGLGVEPLVARGYSLPRGGGLERL